MLNCLKYCISIIVILLCYFIFSSCSEDSSTQTPQPNEPGVNSSYFAFSVGNEWNYNGTGYSASGSVVPKSISTSKLRVISETNSNGLNGYKLYGTFKNWLGTTTGEGEDFVSTENNGLWILERISNGSTSPTKILPFGVNNAAIRSEVFTEQFEIYNNWPDYHIENITMNLDVKFEYLGLENINVTAGTFNNCKKIKLTMDVSQRSDTSGTEIFNGQTWYVESVWWVSSNNGLIKTQSSFSCVVDSIVTGMIWDPNNNKWIYVYESVLQSNVSYRDFRNIDVEDLMIPVSSELIKTKMSGINYLGKYITELSSKNF
jgi:hypothetical protein